MQRMMLGTLVLCTLAIGAPAHAGAPADAKAIKALNELTGLEPAEGMLRHLMKHHDAAKLLIKTALPLAQQKDALGYNAALVLALAAADVKDLKASDAFFHVCARIAAKEQSTRKLAQAYGTLIELYYDAKQYRDCARVCKEVLDLKTDDGKERFVLKAYTDELGNTEYNEYARYDAAKPMRSEVQRILVRALTKQGKYTQALKLADGLIEGKNDWLGTHLKAWVLRESGELADAAKVYETVVAQAERDKRLEPDRRDKVVEGLRAELSNIYVELHQIPKAAAQLEVLLKKHPKEPGYYNDLGYILADHDMRLDEAEKLVRKALALDKDKRRSPDFDPKTDHDNGDIPRQPRLGAVQEEAIRRGAQVSRTGGRGQEHQAHRDLRPPRRRLPGAGRPRGRHPCVGRGTQARDRHAPRQAAPRRRGAQAGGAQEQERGEVIRPVYPLAA